MTFFNRNTPGTDTPHLSMANKNMSMSQVDAVELLQPENELERQLLQDTAFQKGLYWGVPRFGHPEGKVVFHIREVLDNVEKIPNLDALDRRRLRLVTFVHDTFKYLEHKGSPRDWTRHHAIYAQKFLANYTDDQVVLDITRLHDEAYYSWRTIKLFMKPEKGNARLQNLLDQIGNHIQLYYLFFKCDTQTGDKNQAPLKWFEATIPGIEVVVF